MAAAMIANEEVFINGDGETSRDFCHIENVVQANLLAATATGAARNQIYNVAVGDRTTLNDLFGYLQQSLASHGVHYAKPPSHRDFRKGDVRHSQADIRKAHRLLGYEPKQTVKSGIESTIPWYLATNK
jgi:UDP-N-acetylglucosamine 4-epimerase